MNQQIPPTVFLLSRQHVSRRCQSIIILSVLSIDDRRAFVCLWCKRSWDRWADRKGTAGGGGVVGLYSGAIAIAIALGFLVILLLL